MEAYSMDLRARIVESYFAHEGSQAELAERFKVSERWLQNLLRRQRETGSIEPLPHGGGRQRVIRGDTETLLLETIAESPDASLDELVERCGIAGSRMCVARALQRLDFTRKKKSLVCSEQQDPKVQKQRRAWRRQVKDIEPGRFKFLDQTNAKTTFTRVFGGAPRGQRVREYVPDGRWQSLTLMGTVGYWGDMTALTYEGGTDVMAMLSFIEHVLAPTLDRDHIVVLDRLSSHMDPAVAQAVRATGATRWHLPPYSHDFNPVADQAQHRCGYCLMAESVVGMSM